MGDGYKLERRQKDRQNTFEGLENDVGTDDVVDEQFTNCHGDLERTADLRKSHGSTRLMSSSNDESMEISPPLMNPEVKQEMKWEEDTAVKAMPFGELPEKMDIESGFFDQLDDMDTEMTDPLLPARKSLSPVGAEFSLDAKAEFSDTIEPGLSPSSDMSLNTTFKEPSLSPIKAEPYGEEDFQLATSVTYPLGTNFSMSGSFNKWTSSDDLNLPNLFAGPQVTKRPLYYGMTGLNNLGNSCYLNSVVQCLANTRELREYFLSGSYKQEINRRNRMGTKGKFAAVIEETLRALWKGDRASCSPTQLRDIMAERNEQFNTYGQQDAQEAMALIIDSLHEDLNRVTEKPYLSEIESNNRPVEEVAQQTWSYYLSRENSAIYDLFTGMFQSTVECLACHKQNIKFDPYQCVSVPVPKFGVVIDCFFHPRDPKRLPVKFRVDFNKEHPISYHTPQLQAHLGDVPLAGAYIIAVRNKAFWGIITEDFECQRLDESVQFHLYEVLTEALAKEKVRHFVVVQYLRVPVVPDSPLSKTCSCCHKVQVELKRCAHCYSVRYCDSECQKKDWESHKSQCESSRGPPVGLPFVVSLRQTQLTQAAFYMNVAKSAQNTVTYWKRPPGSPRNGQRKAKHADTNGGSGQPAKKMLLTADDSLEEKSGVRDSDESFEPVEEQWVEWKVADSLRDMTKSSGERNTFPFKLIPLDKGIRSPFIIYPRYNSVMKGPDVVKETIQNVSEFLLLWDNSSIDNPCQIEMKDIMYEEDVSCCTLLNERERQRLNAMEEVTLEDCISLLTKPEILSKSNAWMCPTCKVPREASKKFEIWSLPSVLVFQLKRFSKPSGEIWRRDKIETLVDYPLINLDMSQFLVGPGDGGEYLYDLYGAVVHRGSTWYGHYVSHARCYNIPDTHMDDMPWRSFDDESVDLETDINRIVNRGAYLLFYRRRGTVSPINMPPPCSSPDDEEGQEKVTKGPSLLELSSHRLVTFLSFYCTIL